MGMLDKFREFLLVPNDEQYDDDSSDSSPEEEYEEKFSSERSSRSAMREENEKSKIVDISSSREKFSVVLVKPKAYREGDSIADHLNAKKTVILNLEDASQNDSLRLVDFLSGAAYAIGGKIEKINDDIYIIAPYNVDFSGDVVDEITNGILI